MEDGVLSLKWNNHSSSFIHCLASLHQKELYSDVTLACDGQFFEVHKLVLSVCSDYFEEILRKTTCPKPVIVLKDIQYSDLQALLNYMYVGEASILQADLSRLIKAADCLKIKGLAVSQYKDKKRPPDNYHGKQEPQVKKRKCSEVQTAAINQNSFSDIDRLSDSEAEVLDVREPRATIVHHATLRTPTLHALDDNSSSPQPMGAQVILQQHPLPEHHITLRHHPIKHAMQANRSSIHEELIIPTHSIPEVHSEGSIKEESSEDTMTMTAGRVSISRTALSSLGEDATAGTVVIAEGVSQRSGSNPSSAGNAHPISTVNSGGIMHDLLSIPAASQHQETLVTWDGGCATLTGYTLEGILPPEELRKQVTGGALQSSNHVSGTLMASSEAGESVVSPPTAMACGFCPRAFMYKSDLQRHVRTHTGERPYTCSQCTYKASQKSHLLEHMKRKHRQNPGGGVGSGLIVPAGAILMTGSSPAPPSPPATSSSSAHSQLLYTVTSNAPPSTSSSAAHAQLLYTVTSNALTNQPTTLIYSTTLHGHPSPPQHINTSQGHINTSQHSNEESDAAESISQHTSSLGGTGAPSLLSTALSSYNTSANTSPPGSQQHSRPIDVSNSTS